MRLGCGGGGAEVKQSSRKSLGASLPFCVAERRLLTITKQSGK